MKKISKVWIAAAVVAIVALVSWLLSGGKKQEEVTFDTAKVAPANLMNSVTATGTIEPVTSVTVGTQVSGIVSKLYVDYNTVDKVAFEAFNWLTKLVLSSSAITCPFFTTVL